MEKGDTMRLHLGCGIDYRGGYVNVDSWPEVPADEHWDARHLLVPDNSCEEILAIHLMESFYQWEVKGVLEEWHRVLMPNGRLIIESTDLTATIRMASSDDPQTRLSGEWGIYGRQDIPEPNVDTLHKYSWRAENLVDLLKSVGFGVSYVGPATTHDPNRDYRIEAVKASW